MSGRALLCSGVEPPTCREIPVDTGEFTSARLIVGLRSGHLTLPAADIAALQILARLLAATLRAQQLAGAVSQSRTDAITAIEDERRRLRRELHDGLGPTLSGVAFRTDAARNHLRHEPDRTDELLVDVRRDVTGAIGEVRRIVEGLRPPALDELGLVGAVQSWAAGLHSDGGSKMDVTITVDDRIAELPAAIEVAAYRIVIEALTNAARHSGSASASVVLDRAGSDLLVRVDDNGRHVVDLQPGVGISSMRERVAALGGALVVDTDRAGVAITARIPFPDRSM